MLDSHLVCHTVPCVLREPACWAQSLSWETLGLEEVRVIGFEHEPLAAEVGGERGKEEGERNPERASLEVVKHLGDLSHCD